MAATAPRSATPGAGALAADALVEPWFSALMGRVGEVGIFDCHPHFGCADPDGSCFDTDELLAALGVVGGRGVVFRLAEPGSYRAANEPTLGWNTADQLALHPGRSCSPPTSPTGARSRPVAAAVARTPWPPVPDADAIALAPLISPRPLMEVNDHV